MKNKPVTGPLRWFYPLQKKVVEQLRGLYPDKLEHNLAYQVITDERVIEHYVYIFPGAKVKDVIVIMHKSNDVFLIYEAKITASGSSN